MHQLEQLLLFQMHVRSLTVYKMADMNWKTAKTMYNQLRLSILRSDPLHQIVQRFIYLYVD